MPVLSGTFVVACNKQLAHAGERPSTVLRETVTMVSLSTAPRCPSCPSRFQSDPLYAMINIFRLPVSQFRNWFLALNSVTDYPIAI